MRNQNWLIIGIFYLLCTNVIAGELPRVTGLAIDGDQVTWDAQEGATGYNVYLNYTYYDTVRGSQSYTVTEPGDYNVASFNDAGDYGVFRNPDEIGDPLIVVTYTGSSDTIKYDFQGHTLFVYNTCKDVGPGETCIARCPSEYTHRYSDQFTTTVYSKYLSGGACSTSDIVEADAFVSPRIYRCTVPTFSGEVIAQAICVVD